MLSVTASLFKKKDGEEDKVAASFQKALVYVLGMAVMYSSLGVIAAMTGALFGGILQNKWVVVAVSFLMFGLALSMFGVYQLQVPSALLQRLGKARKTNYWGLFFSGMFVGVFAAPCIGPPVIALLASVASRGQILFGFLSFFVFSIGLGLPYLILGTFSGLLQKLPKAGGWLIWVEHLFGVLLVGFGCFYLAIAFRPDWIDWVLPVSLILGGLYLGFVEASGKERVIFVRLKWLFGLAMVIIGISIISSFFTKKEHLVWAPYRVQELAKAQKNNEPVVIDFYADWCITCHELENFVLTHPTVAKELENFVRLRVDATDMMAPEVQKVLEQYGIFGLPIIVFLDANGQEVDEARVTGYVPPAEFLQSMKLVLKQLDLP